jgi:adenylylsulfate kinase
VTQRILVMGLPGAGKTTLAEKLLERFSQTNISVSWFNADEIRGRYNDWDFSYEGRIRQSQRMREFADNCGSEIAICDFVAPLVEMRNNFKADWTIWIDTISAGRFEDTNKTFIPPDNYNFRVTEKDAERWSGIIFESIKKGP